MCKQIEDKNTLDKKTQSQSTPENFFRKLFLGVEKEDEREILKEIFCSEAETVGGSSEIDRHTEKDKRDVGEKTGDKSDEHVPEKN